MSRIEVKNLKPNDQVDGVYLVKYLGLMDSRDGRKYLNIVFADSSGDIEGRVWSNAEDIAKHINKGNFAKVKGKINSFQGRRQLIASTVNHVADSEVNAEDYISASEFSPDEMYSELLSIVKGLDDYYIKLLLESVLNDKEIKRRLSLWQAGKSIHHAYQSGLLEHVLSCARLANTLSDHYKVNKNYVVAGAILHDLCKIYELSSGTNVDYTEEGKLVGHLVKGIELIDRFTYKIKNFPYNTKLHLKHIVLSHHGHYEYGSPKIPQTREAMLVHHIDLMDSKMASLTEVMKSDSNPGHWSGFVRHLDRMVFKGELPYYPNEISDEELAQTKSLSETPRKKTKPKRNEELKQNLGSLLEGFEVKK